MHWLSLLISFFLGKFNVARPPSLRDTVSFLFDEAASRSRKPAILLLGGLACVLLLCGGFFMGAIDLATQWDREGSLRASAGSVGGFVLAVVALGIFYWIFARVWPGARTVKVKSARQEPSTPTLEHALTLLVMDFIKERELRREERHQKPPQRPPTEEHEPPSPLYN